MRSFFARSRLWPALAGTVAVAALAAPSGASASIGQQCSGEPTITGQGASIAKLAEQNIFSPDFNTSTNATACSGSQGSGGKPKVVYNSTASGSGLESWGANGHAASFGPTNAFLDTEIAPSTTIKSEIESHGAAGTVLTIPVLQEAEAIIVHLPAGCTVTGNSSGRLELDNTELEDIFAAETTKKVAFTTWSQLGAQNAISGTGCVPTEPIKRVVREDGAGTTAVVMKYFYLINKAAVDGKLKWLELSEGTNNTKWPSESTVVKVKGDSALAAKVAAEPSTIGYVSLPDARANGSFSPSKGGPNTATFWAQIQNNGTGTTKPKYADPASNGDVEPKGNSNCEKEVYTNGKVKFPPPSVESTWNEVTTKTTETNYPICGFILTIALNSYHSYGAETSEGEATDVENFLEFELNAATGGGQLLINDNDYLGLPTSTKAADNVLKIAQEGAAKVSY